MRRNLAKAQTETRLDTSQTNQIYIALGGFMTAATVVGIDPCSMDCFEPGKSGEILGLTDAAFGRVVCCAAGYRTVDGKCVATTKFRLKPEEVIVRI